MITLADPFSDASPFVAYSYSYPHKMAHRHLKPVVPLDKAWHGEDRQALFLYVHLPFCECRCGFCNLFTVAQPSPEMVDAYLRQIECQASAIRQVISEAHFARFAVGGGTPTFLSERQLARLFDMVQNALGANLCDIPVSCEASPSTVTPTKLRLLVERGVDRISVGIQTFDDQGSKQLGRNQTVAAAHRAAEMALETGFPVLNLDLIYGIPGQSLQSWQRTLYAALEYRPQELYLYPLYVRAATLLGNRGARPNDDQLEAYRLARNILLEHGYQQYSFRMFRIADARVPEGPVYCCQADGMVGLGCGARSYTRKLHYSTEYAVSRTGVLEILDRFLRRDEASFRVADHGYHLDGEDQRRRFTILGLLLTEGLSISGYRKHFGSDLMDDLPQLCDLVRAGLAEQTSDRLRLTEEGIERSDTIGPWLYSRRVRNRIETYQCH